MGNYMLQQVVKRGYGRHCYSACIAVLAICLVFSISYAQTPAPPSIDARAPDAWVVNFKDSDLQTVINQVAEITGDNYVIPPNLTGKVNVLSQTPLTKNELRDLLLSLLYANGFTVTPSGSLLVITPIADAKKTTTPVDASGKIEGETFIVRVLPVKYANVADVLQAVQPLVSDFGVIKNLADANALLVADKAGNVQKIAQLLAQFDVPDATGVETIRLNKNWVGNVMPLLEKLAPRELAASGKPTASPIRIVGDERNNSIMLRGTADARSHLRTMIAQMDQSVEDDATVQVIPLYNADAAKIADMLKDMFPATAAAAATPGATPSTPVSIKANAATNTLVVHAPASVIAQVRRVISQLDKQRSQVLIEAAIVEINDDLLNQIGIQFGAGESAFSSGLVASSLAAGTAGTLGDPATSLASVLQTINAPNSAMIGGGLTASIGSQHGFTALIQALAANSRANLLSTPSITTVDNEEAKIVVGQNVPFRTGAFETSNNNTVNPFTTIQRQDVGITLKVTPQIGENNHVLLKVEQEVSSLQPTTVSGAADIITNKRTINTTIMADNGQTLALGGLISDNKNTAKTKIPLLGDIPVIGLLFQSNQETNTKSDLVVFLRPTVLPGKEEIEGLNLRKYNGLWELTLGEGAKDTPLTAENLAPEIEKLYTPDFTQTPPGVPLPWQIK